mgnify:FL=1
MILKDIDFASLLYNHQQSQQHYSIGLNTMMTNFGAGSGFSSNISDDNTTAIAPTLSPEDIYDIACKDYLYAYICLPVEQNKKDWVLATELILHTILVLIGIVGKIQI